jgi:hypothetical protein
MEFVKIPSKRIVLDEAAFVTLVNGGIVPTEGVEIILQDIGYNRMKSIIRQAQRQGDWQLTPEELQTLREEISGNLETRIDLNNYPF